MLVVVLVSVVCGLVQTQDGECYSNCRGTVGDKCNLCYKTCLYTTEQGTLQYNFTLKECNYPFCALNNTTSCSQSNSSDLSQSDCIQTCCNNPSYNSFTIETFNQCIKGEGTQKRLTIDQIILAIFLLCFVVAIWIFYLRKCKHRQATSNQQQSISQQDSQSQRHSIISNIRQSIRRAGSLFRSLKLIWTEIKQEQIDIFNENCTICLDSNINCQTFCGHKFHFKCINLWIERKQQCPNCKDRLIIDLTLYCQVCLHKQTKFNLKVNQNKIKSLTEAKVVCDQCIPGQQTILVENAIQLNEFSIKVELSQPLREGNHGGI